MEDYSEEKYRSEQKYLDAQRKPDKTELNRQLDKLRPMFDRSYTKLTAADKFVLGKYYYVIFGKYPKKLKCTDVDASGKKSTLCDLGGIDLISGKCYKDIGDIMTYNHYYDLNDPNTEIWTRTSWFGPSASTFKAGRSRKGKRKPNKRKTRRYKKNKKSRRK
jgi:hypothetical protein